MKHQYFFILICIFSLAACVSSEDAAEVKTEERIPDGDLSSDFVVTPGEIKPTEEVVAQVELEKEAAENLDIALSTDDIKIKVPTMDALEPDEMIAMVEQPNPDLRPKGEDGLSQMKLLTELNILRQKPKKYLELINDIISKHPNHTFSSQLNDDQISQLKQVAAHLQTSRPLPGLYPSALDEKSRAEYTINKQLSARYNILNTLATSSDWSELIKLETRAMRVQETQKTTFILVW